MKCFYGCFFQTLLLALSGNILLFQANLLNPFKLLLIRKTTLIMKYLSLVTFFLIAFNSTSFAQNPVTDTHPSAAIYTIDYSSGQEIQAFGGDAVLFKDAFIELVSNTNTSRVTAPRYSGRKTFVITQMDPQTNGYAYQLVLQTRYSGQIVTIYTFMYNADQNTLSYFDPNRQAWVAEMIQGYNVNNLNSCAAYSKFNRQYVQTVPDQSAQPALDADANTPVDADVTIATVPPDMPDYQQPECPQDGYLWQPGYWAYSRDTNGYYWVPGAWVAPPNPGLLWTPPYWGFTGGLYIFHGGYWGNHIGFYGGINYGYGYGGVGFAGGEWREGHFRYNTAVVRVNVTVIHNTYVDRTVIVNRTVVSHSSFNGRGGIVATPNQNEMTAMHEHHEMATSEQIRNQRIARADKSQFASSNSGRPGNLATEKVPARAPVNNERTQGNQAAAPMRPNTPGANGTNTNMNGSAGNKPDNNPNMNGSTGTKPGTNSNANGSAGTKPGTNGRQKKSTPKQEKTRPQERNHS